MRHEKRQRAGGRRRPVTVRVARWSATHPWRAIGLWATFVAACVVAGGAAGTVTATDEDLTVGEAARAVATLNDAGLTDPAQENVLVTARSGGGLDQAEARAAAGEAADRLGALPDVAGVGDPVLSGDGTALLLPVTMSGDPDTAGDRVEPLLDATAAVQADHPGLRVEQAGDASIGHGIDEQVSKDLARSEAISLPMTLVILMVAFGAVVAAGVPVLLALSAVMSAIGLSQLASHLFPDSGTTANVILLIGMAVGIDYSLFYLRREREERARGRGTIDAIEVAAATSGHAVVVSGLAVLVSMAGLYVAGWAVFSSLATGAIIVVAVAVLGSLTVLPALLAALGRAVDRPRVPVLWRLTSRSGPPRLWPALLRPALRRPGAALALAVTAMLALAVPALDMTLRASSEENLPRAIPALRSYDRLTAAFPNRFSGFDVVVQAPAGRAAEVAAGLAEAERRTGGDPLFAAPADPRVRASADRRVHVVRLATPFPATSEQAERSLEKLRGDILPATVGAVEGARFSVGGRVADSVDGARQLTGKLPWVVGLVLGLTFLMMLVTFRSAVVAVSAVALNLLSAAAAFGLLTLVFQYGWAEGLLDFRSTGSVVDWVPLFLFVVLFGLSMDYHVFVVSRIREAAGRGVPTREAVERGIVGSAGVVTSAAVVMVSVFAVFATLSLVEMKQMGVGLAAAILIDATVVRAVVLPSLMILLGRANWWPSRLSRRPSRLPLPAGEPAAGLAAR